MTPRATILAAAALAAMRLGGAELQAQARGAAARGGGSAYTVVSVPDGGTIRGVVSLKGAPPAARSVPVKHDAAACGQTQKTDVVTVGARGGLAGAVVSLTDIAKGAGFPAGGTVPAIDQKNCVFTPHVALVPKGAPIAILNSDPVTHNVHTVGFENRPVNRAQPKELTRIELKFPQPEKIRLKCDMHEWMAAWIVVMAHPYHAVTDRDGGFTLENVPPGTYTLETWHDVLGATTQQVTVRPKETTTVNLSVSAKRGS